MHDPVWTEDRNWKVFSRPTRLARSSGLPLRLMQTRWASWSSGLRLLPVKTEC